MNLGPPAITSEAQALALMAMLGKAEAEFAASLTTALWWVIREGDRNYHARNGTAFFLDAGQGVFGVTANHVLEEWCKDRQSKKVVALQLAGMPFDPDGRHAIIAAHRGIDIATFRITAKEVRAIGKITLTGTQKAWPPPPPQQDRGVYYAGFPGVEKQWLSPRDVSFDDLNEAIAGLEVIRARRAHFINPDGTLDIARWDGIQSPSGRR